MHKRTTTRPNTDRPLSALGAGVRRILPDVAGYAVVVFMVVGIGWFLATHLHPASASDAKATSPSLQKLIRSSRWLTGAHFLGRTHHPVVVVEFADFQCPFCRRFEPVLEAVRLRFRNSVSVVFREFPLPNIHPYAMAAALAAECAADQGRFTAFHDSLFSPRLALDTVSYAVVARSAGVKDLGQFRSCLTGHADSQRVAADISLGTTAGVFATPSLVVDGRLVSGTVSRDSLETLITRALRRSG